MMKQAFLCGSFVIYAFFLAGCASVPTPQYSQVTPKPQINTPEELIAATAQLAGTGITRLHPEYVWTTLADRDQDEEVQVAFNQALSDGRLESRIVLIRVLELKFIHDPHTSALDILGPELSDHFRNFDW